MYAPIFMGVASIVRNRLRWPIVQNPAETYWKTDSTLVLNFHRNQSSEQREGNGVGHNDGRSPQKQSVNQPENDSTGKGQQHAPGKIGAAFGPPGFMYLRDKGQSGERSSGETEK